MHHGAGALSVDDLSARWHRDLLACAPASSAESREGVLADVIARYREPVRRYHTLDHVAAVLATIDELLSPGVDGSAVVLAGWLHDVVYDPTRHDNERRSAAFAEQQLDSLGVPGPTITTTARLILMTATHEVADGDLDAFVLADADLAILGAPPEVYDQYATNIRAEYAHVADELFNAGRLAVVQSFAERPRLFHTDLLHDRLDARARANLWGEIERRRGMVAP
jgi:predicted metal-dependent HD superfamily phosphohydrolase